MGIEVIDSLDVSSIRGRIDELVMVHKTAVYDEKERVNSRPDRSRHHPSPHHPGSRRHGSERGEKMPQRSRQKEVPSGAGSFLPSR